MSFLLSAQEVIAQLGDDDVRIFDATFVLPTMNRDASIEFEQIRIPGAQFFDIDNIADTSSELPHMVPSADMFTEMMQALGLRNDHKVILYDNSPFLSAARAWWLLRLFGKDQVYLLDGGLPAYVTAGGNITHGKPKAPSKGDFIASEAMSHVIEFHSLRDAITQGTSPQIVDARPAGRFSGTDPEPRAGLASGHMPGAINVPITALLCHQTGTLKPKNQLRAIFAEAGFDFSRPAITSCGSGVTAAGLTLALAELGKFDVALYDGSWAEWGASDAPIICD